MPEFVLNATDRLALNTMAHYRRLCLSIGLVEQAHRVLMAEQEFADWQAANPNELKLPDHKHESGYHPFVPYVVPADVVDFRPPVGAHSRACGIRKHDHGSACSRDCPTCGKG